MWILSQLKMCFNILCHFDEFFNNGLGLDMCGMRMSPFGSLGSLSRAIVGGGKGLCGREESNLLAKKGRNFASHRAIHPHECIIASLAE